ncbi:MAG: DUF397 domain-containing protein, partial [Streptomyces sp.]
MNIESVASDASALLWTKSSYSGGNGGECVEVAHSPASVHVRDSKDHQGPRLTVGHTQWAQF